MPACGQNYSREERGEEEKSGRKSEGTTAERGYQGVKSPGSGECSPAHRGVYAASSHNQAYLTQDFAEYASLLVRTGSVA